MAAKMSAIIDFKSPLFKTTTQSFFSIICNAVPLMQYSESVWSKVNSHCWHNTYIKFSALRLNSEEWSQDCHLHRGKRYITMVWHLWFKSSITTCLKFSNFVLFSGSIIYDILRVRQCWKKTSALRCLCLFPAVSNTHFRQPRRLVS